VTTGVLGVGRVGEGDGEGADGSGDEALAAGGVGDAVGPLAALAGGGLVDLPGEVVEHGIFDDVLVEGGVFAAAGLAGVVDEELGLGDGGGAEGVGLKDVGTGLEEAAVDVADHVGLGDGEEVAVVEEVFGGVFEALSADVGLGHAVGADGGAHGSVDDGDAGLEDVVERMLRVVAAWHMRPILPCGSTKYQDTRARRRWGHPGEMRQVLRRCG
jgi:hypothetical protein